jgi:hypothetical protein
LGNKYFYFYFYMLEGRSLKIFTDHQPLVGAIGRATDPKSDRHRRQLSFIAEFAAEIHHISGQSNVVADTLSRPPQEPLQNPDRRSYEQAAKAAVTASSSGSGPLAGLTVPVAASGLHHLSDSSPPSLGPRAAAMPLPAAPQAPSPPVNIHDIADAQPGCPDCQRASSLPALKVISVNLDGKQLLVDVQSGVMRPLVPEPFRRAIFDAVHGLAHPGTRATKHMISSRYLWPNLAAEVTCWCRSCQDCQRAKIPAQPAAAVQPIEVPTQRFLHIHLDLVGPLPASPDGYTHVLTIIDRYTRWAEALPPRAVPADCAAAFVDSWVAHYGVPAAVTSDRGVQFTSSFWAAVMKLLGIEQKLTTAFHPQANGAMERFHRRLKDALRARLAGSDWPSHLP